MAYTLSQNAQEGFDPFAWNRGGIKGKANASLDPGNWFGGNKQSINTTGPQPGMVGWNPVYDPQSESIFSNMQGQIDPIKDDTQGIDKYRQEALRTGPSAWSALANQQQNTLADQSRSAGAGQAAQANATAENNLAMHGGLDSGARERLGNSSQKNMMAMNQGINKDLANNKMQIGINDEQNRVSQLGALPGMEHTANETALQKAAIQSGEMQTDVQNNMMNNQSLNAFNMNQYNQQMAAWGASKQADATASSGKK